MSNLKRREDEYKKMRSLMIRQQILQPNQKNIRDFKGIADVNPKYAKHMFLRNKLVEKFIQHSGGGLDLLSQPVCIHCEKPAAWDMGGGAYCFSCNKSTPKDKAVTVSRYLADQMKNVDEETLEIWIKGAEANEIVK